MSQHDYSIANQTAPSFRSDLNDALGAVVTNNSGSTAPSVTYANQWWYDTTNNILKIRSEADDAWINVGYLDQSTNEFKPYVGGTQITDFLDEDDMVSDSASAIPSQQSVKAYVDDRASKVAGEVGTYALVATFSSAPHNIGDTVSGSNLFPWELYSSADRENTANYSLEGSSSSYSYAGTWRWVSESILTGNRSRHGLAMRIS